MAGGSDRGGAGRAPAATLKRARSVIVFARVPREGMVKTRLAATIGRGQALRVYRELLEGALALAASVSAGEGELCLDGDDSQGECATLAARFGLRLGAQRGADLGERMHNALSAALRERRLPVLIGSDCPALEAADLRAAFDALNDRDAVFSPTDDGGYALVGISKPLPGAFRGPAWGGSDVMSATRGLLSAQGARWAELRTVWDVDDHAGYLRWRTPGAIEPDRAPG